MLHLFWSTQVKQEQIVALLGMPKGELPIRYLGVPLSAKNCVYQRTQGGVKLVEPINLDKAALCKLLWKLFKKKDVLWIQWIHMYYGKSGSLWDARPKQACRIVQKILKAQKHIEEAGMTETDLLQIHTFSIKVMYKKLIGDHPIVPWRRLMCNNPG